LCVRALVAVGGTFPHVGSRGAAFLRERGFELLEDLGGDDLSARYFAPLDRPERATETERVARARIAGSRDPNGPEILEAEPTASRRGTNPRW
jgi:hypothetical protein